MSRLSPHFTLDELLRFETAERIPALHEMQVNRPSAVISNLEHLVTRTLEPMRQGVQLPLQVTSGYRSPDVNRRVGGAKTSQHLFGQAADLHLLLEGPSAQVAHDALILEEILYRLSGNGVGTADQTQPRPSPRRLRPVGRFETAELIQAGVASTSSPT